jgi:hypothetical protein
MSDSAVGSVLTLAGALVLSAVVQCLTLSICCCCCRPAYVGYLLCMVVFVFGAYFLYMHGKKMVR